MPRKYKSPEHEKIIKAWENMKSRCNNPNHNSYKNYGARGIKVCEEWEHDSNAFYEWSIANGYRLGLTLDRKDNNKGYSPENCRWVDWTAQCNNLRKNQHVVYRGKTYTIAELARKVNMPYHILRNRISRGWDVEKAISKPYKKKARNVRNDTIRTA